MDYLDNSEFWAWIDAHIADDPTKLRLAWHGRIPWVDDAVRQIECRRKYRKKLPTEVACSRFYFPTSLSGEQSTSDELAMIHADMIPADVRRVVDLTSGLGVDVMTIARRYPGCSVTAVERDTNVAEALSANARAMGVALNVECADCRDFLADTPDGAFDVAFIDPARRDAKGGRVYGLADCEPDVTAMLPVIEKKAQMLIVKMSPMLDVSQTLRELSGTTDIWALGTSTECKELVACVKFGADAEPMIHVVTPAGKFSFTRSEESDAPIAYGAPDVGGWLYEPWAAVMKVAPWRLLSSRYGTVKLHPNTQLYYSESEVADFPGERYRILEVLPFASSVLKQLPRRYPAMEVAVRNFPITADALARKLRAKQGKDARRIMAATVQPGEPLLIVLERTVNR
jgi:hypothetical protein